MRCSCLVPLMLSAASSLAMAQANRDPLIPRELVEALVSAASYERPRPEIFVGVFPPALVPKVTLPASARILGGMNVQGGRSGANGVVGIFIVDGTLNSAADAFHRSLLAQGWEAPVEDPMMGFMRSEFIDPPSNDRRIADNGLPEMYCGRAGTLNVSYQPDGLQRTQVTLTTSNVNQCAVNRDMMFRTRLGMGEEPKRPKLVNLPNARNSPGSCQNYNMGMGDRKTDLGSQLPPADILAHYAKQLADSGWSQIGTSVAAIFQKRDTTGSLLEYQLLVHSPSNGAGCRSVRSDLNATSR